MLKKIRILSQALKNKAKIEKKKIFNKKNKLIGSYISNHICRLKAKDVKYPYIKKKPKSL